MKFINQSITYKALGIVKEGKIVEITSSKIIVAFSDDNKTFLFPEAFEKFLKLKDEKLQAEVEVLIAEKKEKRHKRKLKSVKQNSALSRRRNARRKRMLSSPSARTIPLTVTLTKTTLPSNVISATEVVRTVALATRVFALTTRSNRTLKTAGLGAPIPILLAISM